ncbi:MAG: hypothetical protein AAB469_00110 [Patescibacteria group bacterium]
MIFKYLNIKKFKRGSALIYVLLTVGIILNIAFFMTSIFASKLKTSVDFPNSVTAFYAADSAVEWQLYDQFKDPNANQPSFSNGATFTITSPPGSFPLKVIGKFRGVTRAIELSL